MKRLTAISVLAFAFVLVAGSISIPAQDIMAGSTYVFAQGTFKIPFKFQAGGKKFPPGEYWVAPKGDGQIALRKEPGGGEVLIPSIERLPQPSPPLQEPQLVFDMVGNFEPSYTEYVTDYLLAEVWLPGEEGFLIHTTKGAHQNQIVKGQKAK
jgi:hypothetical protein